MQYLLSEEELDIHHYTLELNQVSENLNPRCDDSVSEQYYQLRDARQALRRLERESAEMDTRAWYPIITQSLTILKTSKDVEVAAWLLEAMSREFGVRGLHDGLGFINEFLRTHHETLFPQPEDDEPTSETYQAMDNLLGAGSDALIIQLNLVPLFNGIGNLWEYNKARDAGLSATNDYLETLQAASASHCEKLLEQLQQTLLQLAQLEDWLNEVAYDGQLSFREVQNTVQAMQMFVQHCIGDTQALTEAVSNENNDKKDTKASPAADAIQDYEGAVRQIKHLADFMSQTQPHSLITTSLNRLARWVDMPMEQVIQELFLEPNIAMNISHSIGLPVQMPEPNGSHSEAQGQDYYQ